MNWRNQTLQYFALMSAILLGCDSFQDDVLPKGEDELLVRNEITGLPNTELYMDLTKMLNTSDAVRFRIGVAPQRGIALIKEAILSYTPHNDFMDGTDFLAIELQDSEGRVLDVDSLYINMTQSYDSLPCNNGALSDNYVTQKNRAILIEPLLNDGYCSEELSGAIIDFKGEFTHGSLKQTGIFVYQYIPEDDFYGEDFLRYELELIDSEGNSSYSIAQINVNVYEELISTCDSLLVPQYHSLLEPLEEFYIFETVSADSTCGVYSWDVIEAYAESGTVEITEENKIKYYPGTLPVEDITYFVEFNGNVGVVYDNNIQVEIIENECYQATRNYYEFPLPLEENYLLSPYTPNPSCDIFEWSIDIINVEFGSAEITTDQQIKYYPGRTDTTDHILYRVNVLNESFEDHLTIEFTGNGDGCVVANDDFYTIYFEIDSIAEFPYVFHPVNNDVLCQQEDLDHTVELITFPALGMAEVGEDNRSVKYWNDEGFVSPVEVDMLYVLCDEGKCDTAQIVINVDPF